MAELRFVIIGSSFSPMEVVGTGGVANVSNLKPVDDL